MKEELVLAGVIRLNWEKRLGVLWTDLAREGGGLGGGGFAFSTETCFTCFCFRGFSI